MKRAFTITVTKHGEWERCEVGINAFEEAETDYGWWMCACEYLLNLAAQKSPRGDYDEALGLLCKGASTYKTRRRPPER